MGEANTQRADVRSNELARCTQAANQPTTSRACVPDPTAWGRAVKSFLLSTRSQHGFFIRDAQPDAHPAPAHGLVDIPHRLKVCHAAAVEAQARNALPREVFAQLHQPVVASRGGRRGRNPQKNGQGQGIVVD